jgi:broad specificity phosphatase PhoE
VPKLIYIRHGDDRGDDDYRHDRRLNDRGRKKASRAARRLIEDHGHPDVAYVSPYRRAVETLDAMSERFERPVTLRCDARVAQMLSEKQQRAPDVSPQTRDQVAIAETQEEFHRRITAHVEEVGRRTEAVIWCVTHQAVIEEIAHRFGAKLGGDLDYLDHLIVVT